MPQQFVVPQFIDVEDKIFGPITTRQFLILLTGGVLDFIAFRLADTTLFILLFLIIGGLALLFAFVKVNGQTFHYFLLNMFQSFRKPSLRVWKKEYSGEELEHYRNLGLQEVAEKEAEVRRPTATRMRDLSLIVNTGGYYQPEDEL